MGPAQGHAWSKVVVYSHSVKLAPCVIMYYYNIPVPSVCQSVCGLPVCSRNLPTYQSFALFGVGVDTAAGTGLVEFSSVLCFLTILCRCGYMYCSTRDYTTAAPPTVLGLVSHAQARPYSFPTPIAFSMHSRLFAALCVPLHCGFSLEVGFVLGLRIALLMYSNINLHPSIRV